jgi:hypothetical protein
VLGYDGWCPYHIFQAHMNTFAISREEYSHSCEAGAGMLDQSESDRMMQEVRATLSSQ